MKYSILLSLLAFSLVGKGQLNCYGSSLVDSPTAAPKWQSGLPPLPKGGDLGILLDALIARDTILEMRLDSLQRRVDSLERAIPQWMRQPGGYDGWGTFPSLDPGVLTAVPSYFKYDSSCKCYIVPTLRTLPNREWIQIWCDKCEPATGIIDSTSQTPIQSISQPAHPQSKKQ